MSYPDYSPEERLADNVVHVVGVTAALAGTCFLLVYGTQGLTPAAYVAIVIYALSMILMLGASAAYHMAAHTPARPILRRIDHAAIYVKIAATLTPLAVLLGTMVGYVVLAVIWSLAVVGALSKLLPQLPGDSLVLILAGGLIYTGAVVFYCWDSLKYCNAIWHVCVLVATACCFLGISTALPTQVNAAQAVYDTTP